MNRTEDSIFKQFQFWQIALNQKEGFPALTTGVPVAVIGCGTSLHLAQSLAAILRTHGWRAVAVPASEWQNRAEAYLGGDLPAQVITLSRSGETSETVQAAKESLKRGFRVVAVTCEPASSLTQNATEVIELQTSPVEGIVMTSSASLMFLAGLQMAGEAVPEEFPQMAAQLLEEVAPNLRRFAKDKSHFVFLGSGELFGIAQEGALKLQEMSLSYTQAYHPLEYRHGPVALLDDKTLVIMLHYPDPNAVSEEYTLVKELVDKGATVITLGDHESATIAIPRLSPALTGLINLPILQYLGETVAQLKGLDTTNPRNLTKVVMLT
jgi:glucosamine--fructose-6-phosphate aminotransferase (isomerizing)